MNFREAFNRSVAVIEQRYGIAVEISDVVDPNTGDFDGERILLDYDQDLELALFVLLHLFGHTVQWNLSEEHRRIGHLTTPGRTPEELEQIRAYERDATRYGITLLHEAGVTDLDAWISEWCRADWEYLDTFYRTGEKLDARALLRCGEGECYQPLPIPAFRPRRWDSRFSF